MKVVVQSLVAIILICCIPVSCVFYMKYGSAGFLSGNKGFLVVAAVLGALGYWVHKKGGLNVITKGSNIKRTEHGSAEWSTPEDLSRAHVEKKNLNNVDDGTTWFNKDYCLHNHYHALTIAPSRTGKGASVIIPNLLIKPISSLVLTDPKGELACISARYQKSVGQKVYIIDPWNLQAENGSTHGIKPSGFNPFDFIKHDPKKIIDNCGQISELLVPVNPNSKDPYWDDSARSLIKLCMMQIVTGKQAKEHNFWTLYKMLRPQGEEWIEMLADMQTNEAFEGLIGRMSAEYEMPPTESPLRSVLSTAQKATTIFESPELRASLQRSEFNPLDLSNGNCTVYIVIPYEYLQSHSRWLRMVVGLCIRAATVKVQHKVKFILDEFGVLGKMEEIASGFQFLAGKKISFWPFVQDLGTLKTIYGEEGMNKFIANADVLQFFNARDEYTCKYISEKLGKSTRVQQSQSYNVSERDGGGGSSTSYSSYSRELMTPEEVAKNEGSIIFHAKLKTVQRKHFYFDIPVFKIRADKPPR